jgi:hypothetical protein
MNGAAAPSASQNGGAKGAQLKSFAQGTSLFPVPIAGPGGQLTAAANGGNTSVLTPVPKSGFVARFRYNVTGTLNITTAATAAYTVPLWRLLSNYTLQNSLNYPYRSLNGDDIAEWCRVTWPATPNSDPIVNSKTFQNPTMTAVANNVPFAFSFTDEIGQNDGVNFSRYLLSAMTTSNDLTIAITWLPVGNLSQLQQNAAVIGGYTATCAVSAEYLTVPDPAKYQWPRRNLVQQVLGDPSFNTPASNALNSANLTPIQGPEFTGLGVQVVGANNALDPMTPGANFWSEIDIYVNGTIPLYQFTYADLVSRYERLFGRSPANGYIFIDFMSDLSIPNVMSHTHRKVLSTSKYSQISVRVQTTANFVAGNGARINLLKRTQQAYGKNQ